MTSVVTIWSSSSGSKRNRSAPGGSASVSGTRSTIPSSAAMAPFSMPNRSESRALTASAHGACTCMPNGECSTIRQSPSSSRKRSSDQGAVGRNGAGGLRLVPDEAEEVRRRAAVETDALGERRGVLLLRGGERALERADRAAELGGPAEPVALPERHAAGLAEGGQHEHAVVGDLLDPPAGRAEAEDVADARLVDHLLVELADPVAAGLVSRHEEDAEQPAVGDRAAGGDGQPLRARAPGERAGDAVPDDAGSQLGELVGRVAAGQQVQHRLVRGAGERRERRRAAHGVEPGLDLELVDRAPPRRSAAPARRAGSPARGAPRSRPAACARWRRRRG